MSKLPLDFSFLHGEILYSQSVNDLKKSKLNFAHKYKDIGDTELSSEIRSFKYFAM
jgi:hypothetical protein